MKVGRKIDFDQLRVDKGLTKRQLLKELGFHESTIFKLNDFLLGKTENKLMLHYCCKFFGVDRKKIKSETKVEYYEEWN
jgi:hypothetical protein